jgi:hypothetical protein
MKTIKELSALTLIQNDGDALELNSEFGTDYEGFLIETKDGEYWTVYGYYGAVPFDNKTAYTVVIDGEKI